MATIVPIASGKTVNTIADVRAWLHKHGKSLRKLCAEHGLDAYATKSLFRTKNPGKGSFGKTHEAAVALGLKLPPTDTDATPN
jgi:gp16 family phage-associated protein